MGYYAHSLSSNFSILSEKQADAVSAFRNKYPEYEEGADLSDLISDFGFSIEQNQKGDIEEIYYEDEKFRSDEIEEMLDVIAPYIERGSYISFIGEDDSMWAYYFDGEKRIEYYGSATFPGMPIDGPNQ